MIGIFPLRFSDVGIGLAVVGSAASNQVRFVAWRDAAVIAQQ
jgi:hypothetical protein